MTGNEKHIRAFLKRASLTTLAPRKDIEKGTIANTQQIRKALCFNNLNMRMLKSASALLVQEMNQQKIRTNQNKIED
ncbi:hypothetical protein [Allobaculum sp. JKK-2023]|uniref:hypothetical protein n=1 Tax=Allobaculum sp. JKK-2023 TaxID=3108943 RepID=UPI002B05D40D|nr:hypothetical protein [Allobaculum sp. JKK-2023]